MKKIRICIECNTALITRHQIKFCSNQCQMDHQHERWVENWKRGKIHGNIGITARNFSTHLKRYLVEKFNNKCILCGWNEKHSITGIIPLEIDHVDGNSENSAEKNLRLLCPNCHSLTAFYKNLNRGKGRIWRKNKYLKNV